MEGVARAMHMGLMRTQNECEGEKFTGDGS